MATHALKTFVADRADGEQSARPADGTDFLPLQPDLNLGFNLHGQCFLGFPGDAPAENRQHPPGQVRACSTQLAGAR